MAVLSTSLYKALSFAWNSRQWFCITRVLVWILYLPTYIVRKAQFYYVIIRFISYYYLRQQLCFTFFSREIMSLVFNYTVNNACHFVHVHTSIYITLSCYLIIYSCCHIISNCDHRYKLLYNCLLIIEPIMTRVAEKKTNWKFINCNKSTYPCDMVN